MDSNEFLKQEYLTLREEIRETKDRIFKTMGFGLTVVPGSHLLAEVYKLDIIILSLPILVIVVAIVYLSENHAMMRCGTYIRKFIEPNVAEVEGWEQWLEKGDYWDQDRRSVDIYLSYAFYLLFFVYFSDSIFVATRFTFDKYGVLLSAILSAIYLSIGLWFMIYMINTIRTTTTTKGDFVEGAAGRPSQRG